MQNQLVVLQSLICQALSSNMEKYGGRFYRKNYVIVGQIT